MVADPLNGTKWPDLQVTWSFATSNMIGQPDGVFSSFITQIYQPLFEASAAAWSAVSGLLLTEVPDSSFVDIRIGFRDILPSVGYTSWYNDGFGGFVPGVTLSLEDPSVSPVTASSSGYFTYNGYATNMLEVAEHEFGHALGLDHNLFDSSAIMDPYLGQDNHIDISDIQALQKLYGQPGGAPPTPTPTPELTLTIFDVTTSQAIRDPGASYSGPVPGLSDQFIVDAAHASDWINVTGAGSAGLFIHTGAGNDAIDVSRSTATRNVLDGGTGSNFLTGGVGADTFFVDDRGAGADIWSTVADMGRGDDATIWGVTQAGFTITSADGQGAPGHTGLTIHASIAGKPTASLTLAGYDLADVRGGKLVVSFGSVAGNDFMHIVANV